MRKDHAGNDFKNLNKNTKNFKKTYFKVKNISSIFCFYFISSFLVTINIS